MSLNAT